LSLNFGNVSRTSHSVNVASSDSRFKINPISPRERTSKPPENLPLSRFAPLARPRTIPFAFVNSTVVWLVSDQSQLRIHRASSIITDTEFICLKICFFRQVSILRCSAPTQRDFVPIASPYKVRNRRFSTLFLVLCPRTSFGCRIFQNWR